MLYTVKRNFSALQMNETITLKICLFLDKTRNMLVFRLNLSIDITFYYTEMVYTI